MCRIEGQLFLACNHTEIFFLPCPDPTITKDNIHSCRQDPLRHSFQYACPPCAAEGVRMTHGCILPTHANCTKTHTDREFVSRDGPYGVPENDPFVKDTELVEQEQVLIHFEGCSHDVEVRLPLPMPVLNASDADSVAYSDDEDDLVLPMQRTKSKEGDNSEDELVPCGCYGFNEDSENPLDDSTSRSDCPICQWNLGTDFVKIETDEKRKEREEVRRDYLEWCAEKEEAFAGVEKLALE